DRLGLHGRRAVVRRELAHRPNRVVDLGRDPHAAIVRSAGTIEAPRNGGGGGARCYSPAVPDPANGRGAVPIMNRQPLTVAVVGATGVVGRTMIQILNEREFPVSELRLLASGRSAGRTVPIHGPAPVLRDGG